MHKREFIKVIIFGLLLLSIYGVHAKAAIPTSNRAALAISHTEPVLEEALKHKNMELGAPIFIRIFKNSSELELWVKVEERYQHFKTYDICKYSGKLGPKTREGDYQAPEGFYFVTPQQLNPWSQYYLAFNLGYPNTYDRAHGYTGSALMVHGNCVSIGCYAMTNKNIKEIYTLAHKAFQQGQPYFRVHIFPFRLNTHALAQHKNNPWHAFWNNLKEGYDHFETHKRPPNTTVKNKRYIFEHEEY